MNGEMIWAESSPAGGPVIDELPHCCVNHLRILQDLDAAVLSTVEPHILAQRVVGQVCELLPCDAASVQVFDFEKDAYSVLAAATDGVLQSGPVGYFPLAAFPDIEPLLHNRSVLVGDAAATDAPGGWEAGLLAQEHHTYLMAPMWAGADLMGCLTLTAHAAHAFAPAWVSIVQQIAMRLAIAIWHVQLYRSLQDANQELQEALRIKDEMIQNVSHELRTPLTQIIGYGELLAEGLLGEAVNPEAAHALDVIIERSKTLTRLVNMLLRLQTFSADMLAAEPVDLSTLSDQVVQAWVETARRQGITLVLRAAGALPAVMGDPAMLREAVDILLDNALKFTGPGGQVAIGAESTGRDVWLSVSDSGVGIPPDKLTKVFQRFYQVDGSRTRAFGGTGIGLALAHRIVAAHGGRIWAASDGVAGHGTTFYVALPAMGNEVWH